MNDCQIDSYDHNSVRLNSEVLGLCVADVVVVVVVILAVTETKTQTENAETAVRMV